MAQQATSTQNGSDFPTIILMVSILFGLSLGLTAVGFVAALIPIAIYALTGRQELPLSCILLAGGLALWALYTGWYASFFEALTSTYSYPMGQSDIPSLAKAWLFFMFSPVAWLTVAPIGVAIGAVMALISNARKQSLLVALMQGRVQPRPQRAPLAQHFHNRLEARLARRGTSMTLGSEWRTGRRVAISDADLNKHVFITGTTGSGKTTTILNMVEAGSDDGVIIVDGKGDVNLAARVMAFASERGQAFYLFEPTGQIPSSVYNPFASGDFTSLTDRVLTLREWTEPYYQKLAEGFAQTAFKTLEKCGQKVDLLSFAEALDVTFLLGLIKKHGDRSEGFKALAQEVSALRCSEDHIDGLRAEIRNLSNSAIGHLFDTRRASAKGIQVIDLKKVRNEKAIVYFCLPTLVYPERAAAIGKIVTNDLKFVTSTAKTPWRVIFDEFSVFAGPQILNLLNQGRSYGLMVTLASQTPADIAQGADKDGDKFLDQVFGSVNTIVVHRLNASADAEHIAAVAGTLSGVEYTAQTIGGVGTGAASARHTRESVIHPDAIKSLGVGTSYVINKNNGSISFIIGRLSKI